MTKFRYFIYSLLLVLTPAMLSGCGGSENFVATGTNQTSAAANNVVIRFTGVVPQVLARNAQIPANTTRLKLTLCDQAGNALPVPAVTLLADGRLQTVLPSGEGAVGTDFPNARTSSLEFNRPSGVALAKVSYMNDAGERLGSTAVRLDPFSTGNILIENPTLLEGDLLAAEVVPSPVNLDTGGATQQVRVDGSFSTFGGSSVEDATSLAQFLTADSGIATVSPTGLVTSGANTGETILTVLIDGRTIEVPVIVGPQVCTIDQLVAGERTQITGGGFAFQHVQDCNPAFTFGSFRVTNNTEEAIEIIVTFSGPTDSIEVADDDDLVFLAALSKTIPANSSAVFRARYTNSEDSSFNATLDVLCAVGSEKTIPVSAEILPLFTVDQTPISHTHTIGVSTCPDPIGSFSFTNNCDQPVTVNLAPGNVVSLAAPVIAGGGGTSQIPISFDCMTVQSFSEVVSLAVTGPEGISTGDGPTVTVTIVDP